MNKLIETTKNDFIKFCKKNSQKYIDFPFSNDYLCNMIECNDKFISAIFEGDEKVIFYLKNRQRYATQFLTFLMPYISNKNKLKIKWVVKNINTMNNVIEMINIHCNLLDLDISYVWSVKNKELTIGKITINFLLDSKYDKNVLKEECDIVIVDDMIACYNSTKNLDILKDSCSGKVILTTTGCTSKYYKIHTNHIKNIERLKYIKGVKYIKETGNTMPNPKSFCDDQKRTLADNKDIFRAEVLCEFLKK